MTLADITRAVSGRLLQAGPDPVEPDEARGLCTVSDSRQVGAGSVFVAIPGQRVDGHDFVPGMGAKGAVAAIVDHPVDGADLPQILVDDTIRALGDLARYNVELRRAQDSPFTVIGVTGSVGKTTTKDLLVLLLSRLGAVAAPVGSFNNEIGLPLTALKVNGDTRFLVAEMGANHMGEIAGLTRIVPPDLAVVLKVGVAHLGEFGSIERTAQAKSEIVRGLVPGGVSVLNADDDRVEAMAALAPGRVIRFGLGARGADGLPVDVRATDVTLDDDDRPRFNLCCGQEDPVPVRLAISGGHNVMNALAASAVARHLGLGSRDIADVLGEARRISPHRMDVRRVDLPDASFTLIDDSFNANPDSTRAGLKALAAWKGPQEGRAPHRIAVLGAMLELGPQTLELHAQVGATCCLEGVDLLVAVGSRTDGEIERMAEALAQGARDQDAGEGRIKVILAHDVDQARSLVEGEACSHPGSVVLLKGSHASGLGGLADAWLGSAHE